MRWLSIAGLTLQLGCGAWVMYPEGTETSSSGGSADDYPAVERLEHLTLGAIVEAHTEVVGDHVLFDYDALAEDGESSYLLSNYIGLIASVRPFDLVDHAEKLAFWLNAYNAFVLEAVVARYDGSADYSVSDDDFAVFGDFFFSVAGLNLSLDEIEHGVMRGDWNHAAVASIDDSVRLQLEQLHIDLWQGTAFDPRLHMAINCASLGCPNLPAQRPFVYRASVLAAQLNEASRQYCENASKGAGPAGISQIFDWFADDFLASHGTVTQFISENRVDGGAGVDFDTFIDYDWTLNRVGAVTP